MKYVEFTHYYFIWTVRTCQYPGPPRHGDIKCASPCDGIYYIYGSNCTATCQKGYDLWGDAERTCKEDGHWTGRVVRCKRK